MQVGDLVKCALEIYGLGVVIDTGVKVGYKQRITVKWFDPPKWLMLGTNISTHKIGNLEVLCK